MKLETKIKKKHKVHHIFKNSRGIRLPSVTSITGVLNKPGLVYWAHGLGVEGIAIRDYVDTLAGAGTCAHMRVEYFYRNEKVDLSHFSLDEIDLSEISFNKFLIWQKEHNFFPIEIEAPLVSEKHQYGGIIDLYGLLHGKKTLIDIKTSKALYDDHLTQVSGGYGILCKENDFEIDDIRILRLGRNENEGFECKETSALERELHEKRFLLCRELYDTNKKLGLNKWKR